MVDAGPEPMYAEKMRVLPTPWGPHVYTFIESWEIAWTHLFCSFRI